ncbi:heterokaryon incompatibility protein-domain-containing protein [Lasiosphaeria ovina]|uniref:Heterokaryon incompatibility protein-domain-containing protein n=1 Tax=Lasiosphaeria ovina TaxID=92902 RepID=A0AAE0NA77_9PEZI|nr:heterokaryon incompatibility protein-domain-containing protein [Lasiosphaeria ovina]
MAANKPKPETEATWALLDTWSLCSSCLQMFSTKKSFQVSVVDLEVSSSGDQGCQFCAALAQAYRQLSPSELKEQDRETINFSVLMSDSHTVQMMSGFAMRIQWRIFIMLQREPQLALAKEDDDDEFSRSPGSRSFIQKQLSACLSGGVHSNCMPKQAPYMKWPQRMLKISSGRIALTDFGSHMEAHYAALSYCWGTREELKKNPPFVANDATYDRLKTGIPFSELPLTVRQAVKVCLTLNIAYIWVDALCIIQDDPSDWEREAKKMATVYSMAKITIIAASSTSCHSGFIAQDIPTHILNTPLPPPLRLVAQRETVSGFHCARYSGTDSISTRGWTYQEEFLSTRHVKFTHNDVQWWCNHSKVCMCGQPTFEEDREPGSSIDERWCDVVTNFSARQLSHVADKLPAISGLIRKLAPEICPSYDIALNSYLAGVWAHRLLTGTKFNDLMWANTDGSGKRPDVYVAPSFSWASITGRVSFMRQPVLEQLCHVLDASTTLTSQVLDADRFGRVSTGFLTLRGPLIPCIVRSLEGSRQPEVNFLADMPLKSVSPMTCNFDCSVTPGELTNGDVVLHRSSLARFPTFDEVPAHVLLVYHRDEARDIHEKGMYLSGLLLGRPLSGQGYERIAYLRAVGNDGVELSDLERWIAAVTLH